MRSLYELKNQWRDLHNKELNFIINYTLSENHVEKEQEMVIKIDMSLI